MKKLMKKSVAVNYVRTQPKNQAAGGGKKQKLTDLSYTYTLIKSKLVIKKRKLFPNLCLFLDAVRKRYQGATDKVINDQITAFFSTAGDRENGREERRQRAKSRKDEINENLL